MKEKIEKKAYIKDCPLIKGETCKKTRCTDGILRRCDYQSCDYYRKIMAHDDTMREGEGLYNNDYLGKDKSSLFIPN